MYLLIDTSTRSGAVGLWRDAVMVGVRLWHSPHNHTAELMPAVDELMRGAGVAPRALTGIGVATGPGGFSALRAGLGAAKGLALALEVPLAGVSTLEAAAYPHRAVGQTLCSIVEAGRTLVAWATFEGAGGTWRRTRDDEVSAIDEAIGACESGTLFVGEGAAAYAERIGPARVSDGGPESRLRGLAELAAARLDAGDADPLASLEPNYARPPNIGTPRSPRAVRHGARRRT